MRIHPSSDQQHPEEYGEAISCADDIGVRTNSKLAVEGWERRSLVDPARAEEFIELYESLGFEVLAQTLTPEDFADSCRECASTSICRTYLLIHTRKRDGKKHT